MEKIGLIVAREWNEKVRKKSFVVTPLLTPLLMVGMIALVSWLSSRGIGGVKHIEELIRARQEGYEATICFVIQMDRVQYLTPNDVTHPEAFLPMEAASITALS